MRAGRGGFSLIEAMAALLIASLVLLAALSLQQQMALAEQRYERALGLSEMKRTAMTLVRDVNPAAEPVGWRPLAGHRRVSWTSIPVTDFQLSREGRFEVRLYRMDVTILEQDGRATATLRFDRVGWRPVQRGAGTTGSILSR